MKPSILEKFIVVAVVLLVALLLWPTPAEEKEADTKKETAPQSAAAPQAKPQAVSQTKSDVEVVYKMVDTPAVFPGGEAALLRFVAEHIEYPPTALDKNIQGVVLLRFVVMEDGSIGDVLVTRGIDPDCDKEAVRVINSLPRFIPGRQDGKPAKVWYTLPIRFQIQD